MNAKLLFQNIASDTPRAIDGMINGMVTSRSNIVALNFPNFFRAITIAIGSPSRAFRTVTIAANAYDTMRLCQYSAHMPVPDKDSRTVLSKRAANAGSATKSEGTSTIARKIISVIQSRDIAAFFEL